MIKIGLTMRTDLFGKHKEERNSIDPNWFNFLARFNCNIILFPNHLLTTKSILDLNKIDLLIFSGGGNVLKPKTIGDINRLKVENYLIDYSMQLSIPIIGICRGAQALVCNQGGTLASSEKHAGIKHLIYLENERNSSVMVNSYHNFVIENQTLPSVFRSIACDEDKNIEAAVHIKYPWLLLMWHPERDYHEIDELFFETILYISKTKKDLNHEIFKRIKKWIK